MLAAVRPGARQSGRSRGPGGPAIEGSQVGAAEAGAMLRYLGHNAGLAEPARRRSRVRTSGGSRRT